MISTHFWIRMLAAALMGGALCTVLAAPTFRILAYQVPEGAKYCVPQTAVNDGTVTGYCRMEGRNDVRFVWAPDGTFELSEFQGVNVFSRNDRGESVGRAATGEYLYQAPGQSGLAFLQGTWAEPVYYIAGINERGHVLGVSVTSGCCGTTPWIWSLQRGLSPIFDPPVATSLAVTHLNNREQVTGSVDDACETRAFAYDTRSKRVQYLGPGGFPKHRGTCQITSRTTTLNDVGQVVGTVDWNFDFDLTGAYLWMEGSRAVRIAGNSDHPDVAGYFPSDINNRGQVVGSFTEFRPVLGAIRAFYWDQHTPATRMSELIDPADPLLAQVELREDNPTTLVDRLPAITETGEIIVRGFLKPREPGPVPDRFFRLIPTGGER